MDKKLKEAIDKGRAAKERKERAERKAREDARTEHQKYIASFLPQARKWIKDVLYAEIAKEEASGSTYRSIYLGSGKRNGIPAEAIYEAAKKIKGLKPTYECPPIYEHAEFQGVGDPIYSIKWDSTDPNDNRNDR
jgi:hypothetical protein